MLSAARQVAVEYRDARMGPNARLDMVERASNAGATSSYEVKDVALLCNDANFPEVCASEPGPVADLRHGYKLDFEYLHRLQGARLVPLVAGIRGRWQYSVPRFVRRQPWSAPTDQLGQIRIAVIASFWDARLCRPHRPFAHGSPTLHRCPIRCRNECYTTL